MENSWFFDNVLTVHNPQSFLWFFVFFAAIYFIGKWILDITSNFWGFFVFVMASYFIVTPTGKNPIIQVIQENMKSFDNLENLRTKGENLIKSSLP
jgi:hypothetical protein